MPRIGDQWLTGYQVFESPYVKGTLVDHCRRAVYTEDLDRFKWQIYVYGARCMARNEYNTLLKRWFAPALLEGCGFDA